MSTQPAADPYVGTPGVDERLQTGQNPILVSANATSGAQVGQTFNDKQGLSLVLVVDNGQTPPTAADCPSAAQPPKPVNPPLPAGATTAKRHAVPVGTAQRRLRRQQRPQRLDRGSDAARRGRRLPPQCSRPSLLSVAGGGSLLLLPPAGGGDALWRHPCAPSPDAAPAQVWAIADLGALSLPSGRSAPSSRERTAVVPGRARAAVSPAKRAAATIARWSLARSSSPSNNPSRQPSRPPSPHHRRRSARLPRRNARRPS